MTPELWERVEAVYHAALTREGEARSAFVREECSGNAALRREVELLLAQAASAEGFVERPAADDASQLDGSPRFASASLPDPGPSRGPLQLTPGSQLGPYQILSLLGTGGMGQVYKAFDARLRREVAIKVAGERFTERFNREVHAVAALNHPNICTVHDVGVNYLVMELVDGETLRTWIRRGLPVDRSLGIARQVLEALSAAHRAGVIHRDLKPENVMVRVDGYVKVVDFGLAKWLPTALRRQTLRTATMDVSQPGQILGTLAYMSPEQIEGQDADQRSDLFAFGILLYEMLAGRHPWPRPSSVEILHAILHDDPSPIDPPQLGLHATSLERIVRRCLAKEPGQRFQTIGELQTAFEQAATKLTSRSPSTSSSKSTEHQPSIAVLPFANMSADKENEFFGDGLTEEIINVLAQAPGMKVAGRTSSFFFRGKDVEFGEIGRRLSVDHILEGSVRKAGNRIRVTAQLIKVADGFHLWSERYDRELTDIFAIQDEITHSIAAALRIKLSPEVETLRSHAPNLRAYAAYLEARDHWVRPTPESLTRVKECLQHAIELDPKFALAYSLLGGHYTMLANLGIEPARKVIPLARAAEQEALRIEPSLPEAHALLGVCAGADYDWNEAEREWRLAMAHEPVSRDVRFWYGNHYLLWMGRVDEAVEAMARGLQEDPLNVLYRALFAAGLRLARRLEDAEAELRKILEIDENFPLAVAMLGAICAQQGRLEEALNVTERAYALTPWRHPVIGQFAALLIRAGDANRAGALLEKLGTGKEYGAPMGLAVFHAVCGEFDRAAEWAGQAIEERYPRLVPDLGPLLGASPRWPALIELMNLPG